MDNSQNIVNQVSYGFKVTSSNGSVVAELKIKRLQMRQAFRQ
jgi:hypothetical protein